MMNLTAIKQACADILVLVIGLYVVGLYGWAVVSHFMGDRWWWLFLINNFALYLFAPIILFGLINLMVRRKAIWISLIVAGGLALYFYGALLIPSIANPEPTDITVMTYNTLGYNEQIEGIIAEIDTSGADLIAIQELNPVLAQALQTQLKDRYPYQILDAATGTCGIGTISRYPLRPTSHTLPGQYWCGPPQILRLDFGDQPVVVINFHAIPPAWFTDGPGIEWTAQQRENQAHVLVNFTTIQPHPVIALGDLNAGEQSVAYKIITDQFIDAWRKGGWGPGHTFPGSDVPGSSRARIAGILVPKWLVRIDYIFHTTEWQTKRAWLGEARTLSDHRAVLATLALQP